MSGHEIQTALHEAEPGVLLADVRYVQSGVSIKGLRSAEVPENSPLLAPDSRVFVTTNGVAGHGDMAIGLVGIHEGEATLSIEPRRPGVESNVRYIRGALQKAMELSEVKSAEVEPESAGVTPEVLQRIGFLPVQGSTTLKFNIAA
jgi:hypothetical protein